MSKTTWHTGAPPSIGWWPASASETRNKRAIRWWDGKNWSDVAWPGDSETEAAYSAKEAYRHQADIRWAERWWL